MGLTTSHSGKNPETIFVVVRTNEPHYWVYLKEGHAINRMLQERKSGNNAKIIKYIPGEEHDS